MNTFEDFKNQVAVKHHHKDWEDFDDKCESVTIMYLMMNEATTLFVESERKRLMANHKIDVKEAHDRGMAVGFNDCINNTLLKSETSEDYYNRKFPE